MERERAESGEREAKTSGEQQNREWEMKLRVKKGERIVSTPTFDVRITQRPPAPGFTALCVYHIYAYFVRLDGALLSSIVRPT